MDQEGLLFPKTQEKKKERNIRPASSPETIQRSAMYADAETI